MAKTLTIKPEDKNLVPSPFQKVLPGLGVKNDRLLLRLDFYRETIVMETFEKDKQGFKVIDPRDITRAFEKDYSFSSGFLPPGALWTSFTKKSQRTAIWVEPSIRRLAVKVNEKTIDRYNIPVPGLIFILEPASSPWVYACPERPNGAKTRVYSAPFPNVYQSGATCGGNNRYPAQILEIPESFFRSFFTTEAVNGHSKKYPTNVCKMWAELEKTKVKEYPIADLNAHGFVSDLMKMEFR